MPKLLNERIVSFYSNATLPFVATRHTYHDATMQIGLPFYFCPTDIPHQPRDRTKLQATR
jgi:hypothetical protein